MAVGDTVFVLGRLQTDTFTRFTNGGHLAGMLMGLVTAEGAGTADVAWENGEFTSGMQQSNLSKIFFGAGSEVGFVARWGQIKNWISPAAGQPNELPKSPAAAGLVHRCFGVSSYDGSSPDGTYAFVSLHDGRVRILVPVPSDAVAGSENVFNDLLVQSRKRVFEK